MLTSNQLLLCKLKQGLFSIESNSLSSFTGLHPRHCFIPTSLQIVFSTQSHITSHSQKCPAVNCWCLHKRKRLIEALIALTKKRKVQHNGKVFINNFKIMILSDLDWEFPSWRVTCSHLILNAALSSHVKLQF